MVAADAQPALWVQPGTEDQNRTRSLDVMRFSTASTIPSFVQTPTAVDPSCRPLRLVYSGLQTRSWAAKTWEGVTHLDCLYRILDLKQSAFRAKCVYATVVFRSGQEHGAGLRELFVSETDQAAAHTLRRPNSDIWRIQFLFVLADAHDHVEPGGLAAEKPCICV